MVPSRGPGGVIAAKPSSAQLGIIQWTRSGCRMALCETRCWQCEAWRGGLTFSCGNTVVSSSWPISAEQRGCTAAAPVGSGKADILPLREFNLHSAWISRLTAGEARINLWEGGRRVLSAGKYVFHTESLQTPHKPWLVEVRTQLHNFTRGLLAVKTPSLCYPPP